MDTTPTTSMPVILSTHRRNRHWLSFTKIMACGKGSITDTFCIRLFLWKVVSTNFCWLFFTNAVRTWLRKGYGYLHRSKCWVWSETRLDRQWNSWGNRHASQIDTTFQMRLLVSFRLLLSLQGLPDNWFSQLVWL